MRHKSIRPSHPVEIIADSLEALGASKVAAARSLGISRNTLDSLLDRKQGVTAAMALRLEAVFGSTAETWLNLQATHDLWQARQNLDVTQLRPIEAA